MESPVISNDVVQKCEVVSEGDVGLTAVNLHASCMANICKNVDSYLLYAMNTLLYLASC